MERLMGGVEIVFLSDPDGDNVWEFTTLIGIRIHEYKFSADN